MACFAFEGFHAGANNNWHLYCTSIDLRICLHNKAAVVTKMHVKSVCLVRCATLTA